MVFEEFLLESLKPRVVILDMVKVQIFTWAHVTGWEWLLGNREALQAESPATLAAILREVNSTARSVANQFLERFSGPVDPPINAPALMGPELGLSLSRDLFWLPDDLQKFGLARLGPPAVSGPADDDNISVIMISLASFEEGLGWAMEQWENSNDEFTLWFNLKALLLRILDCFPSAGKLIVTVDVPRRNICWAQLQEVGVSDTALLRMGGDGARRCRSVNNAYQWLHQQIMGDEAHEDFLFGPLWSGGELPELSFAFLRPA